MKIIKTSEALPKSGRYVLAWLEGAKIPMRAMWAAQHTLPLGDDADPEWGEYSEEKDDYFCPAGWYEMNQHEEQHWGVSGNVVAWCELPRLDHQCLTQIEEPQTLAGTTIEQYARMFGAACDALGEISDCLGINSDIDPGAAPIIAAIEQLRAGAAPAAVAPLGEYPPLPEPVADWVQRGSVSTGGGSLGHEIGREGVFTAAQMRAYFDLGRQAAPALEAPAAPAVEALRALMSLVRREAPHLSGKVMGEADAILARAALAAAPQAPAAPVAYLDLGAGGYMDLGTDLSEQQLGALPKGRHMLAIIGTHGIDGYAAAPAAPAVDAPALGEWVATLEVDSEGGLDYETVPPCTLPPGCYRLYRAAQAKEGGA